MVVVDTAGRSRELFPLPAAVPRHWPGITSRRGTSGEGGIRTPEPLWEATRFRVPSSAFPPLCRKTKLVAGSGNSLFALGRVRVPVGYKMGARGHSGGHNRRRPPRGRRPFDPPPDEGSGKKNAAFFPTRCPGFSSLKRTHRAQQDAIPAAPKRDARQKVQKRGARADAGLDREEGAGAARVGVAERIGVV